MAGLYIHIPFCSALCPYCDFAVVVGREESHEAYGEALRAELAGIDHTEPFDTVFIGGGTPSFVGSEVVARVLEDVPIASGAEVTVEANPESVERDAMAVLVRAGVNRVSIGAQSFIDHVLGALGRTHSADDIPRAVASVRDAGIDDVNLDLIFGGPGESDEDWAATVDGAIALEPTHLSCYALTIEERTPFGGAVARGAMNAPDDDALATRYEVASDRLRAAGYEHYEVSNWSLPGRACRHNVDTWHQGDYVGIGIGAHSHASGVRWWNTRSLTDYLADPTHARAGEEHLSPTAQAEEWLSLRIRLAEGVDLDDAAGRLSRDIASVARGLASAGLVDLDAARLTLTARGRLLENEVTGRLLAAPALSTPQG